MYNVRWRLAYADDSVLDELLEGSSVKDVRPGAIAVQLVNWAVHPPQAFIQVFLNGEKPVVYRTKSISVNNTDARTEAVVIGRGRETDRGFDGDLWQWTPERGEEECADINIDRTAIEWLVGNA